MQAKRILRSKRFLGAAAFCGAIALSFTAAAGAEERGAVATVNGEAISWSAVDPHTEWPEFMTTDEARRELAHEIRETLLKQTARDVGIAISPEEIKATVDARFDRVVGGQTHGERVATQLPVVHKKMKSLAAALQAAHDNPEESDAVFEEIVAPDHGFTKPEWKAFRAQHQTEEKIASVASRVPRNIEEVKANARRTLRLSLLRDAIQDELAGDFSVTKEDARRHWRQMGGESQTEEFPADYLENEREAVRQAKREGMAAEAWLKILERAEITIEEPELVAAVPEMKANYRAAMEYWN